MRHFLLISAVILFAGCEQQEPQPQENGTQSETSTILKTTDNAQPLLLQEAPDQADYDGPMADNSGCYVCHVNYSQEKLAILHARADIGCIECHGISEAHCDDEDNITPPDIMYPQDKINSSCMACHARGTIDIESHADLLAGTSTEKKYCTDCHGKHRLGHRTRIWDKATGRLLTDDKVRMMTEDMLK